MLHSILTELRGMERLPQPGIDTNLAEPRNNAEKPEYRREKIGRFPISNTLAAFVRKYPERPKVTWMFEGQTPVGNRFKLHLTANDPATKPAIRAALNVESGSTWHSWSLSTQRGAKQIERHGAIGRSEPLESRNLDSDEVLAIRRCLRDLLPNLDSFPTRSTHTHDKTRHAELHLQSQAALQLSTWLNSII